MSGKPGPDSIGGDTPKTKKAPDDREALQYIVYVELV
jgi:hypothetical protein